MERFDIGDIVCAKKAPSKKYEVVVKDPDVEGFIVVKDERGNYIPKKGEFLIKPEDPIRPVVLCRVNGDSITGGLPAIERKLNEVIDKVNKINKINKIQ